MYVIFHITPGFLLPGKSLTTLEHQNPCPILLELYYSSSPTCKNHKKPDVDDKIQAWETH